MPCCLGGLPAPCYIQSDTHPRCKTSRSVTMVETLTRTPPFRQFAAGLFRMCQKLGINITPRHFYWPIPDLDLLSRKDWTAPSLSDGVVLELDKQLRLLEAGLLPFCAECYFCERPSECDY